MKYELQIYKDGKFIDEFKSEDEMTVLKTFVKAILNENGHIRKIPYVDRVKVICSFPNIGGSSYKYNYTFYGITRLS